MCEHFVHGRVEAGKAYLMASVCPTLLMVWLSINKKENYHHIIIQLTLKIFVLWETCMWIGLVISNGGQSAEEAT